MNIHKIIVGFFLVAEKYIKLLERTLAYRDWAKERRRFLYNDKAGAYFQPFVFLVNISDIVLFHNLH